jgi:hypothetical protein
LSKGNSGGGPTSRRSRRLLGRPSQRGRERESTVASFSILYKTLADPDGWESGLGPILHDRDEALDLFNKNIATDKNLGQFTFDDTGLVSDYSIVEMVNPPVYHPLFYKK